MFPETLRRLTLLNSIVFLLIFIAFGTIIYGYVARQLFNDVDEEMQRKAEAIRITNGRPGFGVGPGAFYDPRVFIFLRNSEGQIINLYPFPVEEITRVLPYLPQIETGVLQNKHIEDHLYRIRSIPYQYEDNILLRTDAMPTSITEVLAITVVDSEIAMLRKLAIIIIAGLIVGMIVIILAGYYLAKRALVPIRAAWGKQQQFVADASHELRSPLAVIKVNAELLLRHPERTIEQESIRITNVIRETIRMNNLV
jgi:two-component system sensor histidine kinase CiaH